MPCLVRLASAARHALPPLCRRARYASPRPAAGLAWPSLSSLRPSLSLGHYGLVCPAYAGLIGLAWPSMLVLACMAWAGLLSLVCLGLVLAAHRIGR